jgi:hypothetical protein
MLDVTSHYSMANMYSSTRLIQEAMLKPKLKLVTSSDML